MTLGDWKQKVSTWWSSLARDQRVAVGVLGACGFFAVVFSWMQMSRQLVQPFFVSRTAWEEADTFLSNQEKEAKKVEEMKYIDTDGDGLSDYSEQYAYRTSPYIIDSDSDGLADSFELAQGEDPNCPRGRVCRDVATETLAATTTFSQDMFESPLMPLLASLIAAEPEGGSSATRVQSAPPPGTLSAEQVRQFFAANNVAPMEDLRQLPDADILSLYKNAYESAQAQVEAAGRAQTPSASLTADDEL